MTLLAHTYITSLVPKLVLRIITHMDMVANIALDNNQYPWDWFKKHLVTIGIKKFKPFMPQPMYEE
jgi:hypothetical protein